MSTRRSTLGRALVILGWALKLGFAAAAVLLPLLGVWIASSLAAHHDGPLWASFVAGALCFPLLPLGWDLFATWRRSRRAQGKPRPRVLTTLDRLVLRTLVVNLAFVGGLLATFPATVFEALSTRGDWMLPQGGPTWVERTRGVLFGMAERMGWLHEATHDNAYEELVDPSLTRTRSGDDRAPEAGEAPPPREPAPADAAERRVAPEDLYRTDGWPFAPTLHPLVASLPPAAETSIESVARYVVEREPDPVQRIKALHDYVADRVAYDVPAYLSRRFPPQDAQSVFERRTAVCAGSAALLAALGRAAGMEIVVVVGDARGDDGLFDGNGHAWNAIELDGRWYLADPTWDAGYIEGDRFVKRYDASWLMTPPEAFVASHMPEDPKWQLLPAPLSPGDFLRQPDLRPSFAALGLRLVEPQRAQSSARVGEAVTVRLDNPHGFEVFGNVRSRVAGDGGEVGFCELDEPRTTLRCPLPEAGRRQVVLFGPSGDHLGQLYVDVG